ncbi:MAG: ATP-binding protein [Chloroflexi bacterium]|nr:ATP-binding protein [Chloroflexota bacterium]
MTTITESQWVNYFGFQRFPFDRPEAGNEEFARPDFLASCFVEPRGFERVFGQADSPVTSLLFAARGTGKTACRVMMDYYCQNGLARLSSAQFGEPNFVLSVPHIRLDNVREIARQSAEDKASPQIFAEHHALEIMRQAVPAFVSLIAKNTEFARKVTNLSKANFEDLSFYIILYSAYLTSPQKEFLRDIGVAMPPIENQMRGLVGQSVAHERSLSWGPILIQQRIGASPLFHLERWAMLMPVTGIKSIYVLVDGVDELMESADDPQYAHALIRPILTNLKLMDGTHHLAFKFFLPSDIETNVLADKKFRMDRGFVIQKLEWKPDDLVDILRERLGALRRPDYEIRDRTAAGFDSLCMPELRGQIEQDIIEITKGNPRRLMNFCSLMITSHCQRDVQNQDDPYQLSREDFEQARLSFEMPVGYLEDITTTQTINIQRLIAEGESEYLEFKSSMRYDYKRQTINKDELGFVIAKTLAGFMNHSGGILLIGINDEGQILGIEKDIETLTKKSVDGFQLAFKDIVRTQLGLENLINTHLYFEELDGHTVCAVLIEKSSIPVYVKTGNDNEFYVRMLNSTIKLSLPETVSYIRSRWG